MADTMFRVALDRVFPGCANLDPPTQPPEADSELNLEQCLSWPMLWPKELIRVDSCFTTPQQNEPFAAQPADLDHDDNDARVEDFLVDYDEVLPAASEGPLDDTQVAGPSQGPPSCRADQTEKFCSRRLFSSQGAPEAAAFSPGDPAGLSQDTLKEALQDSFVQRSRKTTGRKRIKKRAFDSSSQPVEGCRKPIRVQDKVPMINWHPIHELGKPMLPANFLEMVTSDMRSLHSSILYVESNLAKDDNPTYPLFIGKVPEGLGFVDQYPGDLFFLRFNDIFDMFHMNALHPSMVRLVALSLAHQLIKENTRNVAIMDPFYMQEMFLNNPKGKVVATKYIEDFFADHPSKNIFLLPYFPE